ncbi:MAG: LolA family protein [Myxococcota bacterium]
MSVVEGIRRRGRCRAKALGLSAVLLVFCSLAEGMNAQAADDDPAAVCGDADAALERMQSRYNEIQDLSAVFTQTSESVVLAGTSPQEALESAGNVVLAKPGRMRWSYRDPDPSLVVSNGEVLWIYDVAAKQVTRASVGRGYLAGAALQFLLGEARLRDLFEVEETACSSDGVELELSPRNPASYEKIRATVDRRSGLVSETSVYDLFGNRTTLSFREIVLNQSPDDSVFVFRKPDDVELIDMGGVP